MNTALMIAFLVSLCFSCFWYWRNEPSRAAVWSCQAIIFLILLKI